MGPGGGIASSSANDGPVGSAGASENGGIDGVELPELQSSGTFDASIGSNASAALCDGRINEDCPCTANQDCPCTANQTTTCGTLYGSAGDCASRELSCPADLSWPTIDECSSPNPELCNKDGRDENCDGRINEAPCGYFTDLALNQTFGCGVASTGGVLCWGQNSRGELGDGTRQYHEIPNEVPGITTARSVGASAYAACVLLADGTVRCWGSNFTGELGDGTGQDSSTPVLVQTAAGVPLTDVRELATGYQNCALLNSGDVYCWGYYVDADLFATRVPELTAMVSIAGDSNHTCGITSSGRVRCWGQNSAGELGDGNTAVTSPPVEVVGLPSARQVVVGNGRTCALTTEGTVFCWGSRYLGSSTTDDSSLPLLVEGLSDVQSLSGGRFTTCATLADGTQRCWGEFALGSIPESRIPGQHPALVALEAAGARVAAFTPGLLRQCVLMIDGAAYCWGFDYDVPSLLGRPSTGVIVEQASLVFGP